VREGDLFEYDLGDVRHHIPYFLRRDADKPKEPGKIFAAYCRATLKDGTTKTEVLSWDEVEGIRKRSRAGQSGPWVTDWGEMAKKTVIKRAHKTWPKTERLDHAIYHLNTDGEEGLHELAHRAAPAANDKPVFDRAAWIEKAQKAANAAELETVWKQGADAARKAADREGYDKFKTVVTNAGAKLKAVDAEVKEGGAA
jgi:recombination protein RecT